MAISVDQIDLWRQEPSEREVLEFKEAANQYDTNKLLGYCVAISNEGVVTCCWGSETKRLAP
jgi:hypothetical protein